MSRPAPTDPAGPTRSPAYEVGAAATPGGPAAAPRAAERAVHRLFELQTGRAFDTWLAYAEGRAAAMGALATAVARLRQQRVGKGLRTWAEFAELRATTIYLVRRVAQGKLYAALSTWMAMAEDRMGAMETAQRVVLRFMSQKLGKGFATFVAYCEEARATAVAQLSELGGPAVLVSLGDDPKPTVGCRALQLVEVGLHHSVFTARTRGLHAH